MPGPRPGPGRPRSDRSAHGVAHEEEAGGGGEQIGKDDENGVNDEDQDAPAEESNKIQRETHDQNDAVETVTSHLEEATIEEDAGSKQEETDDDKEGKLDDDVADGVINTLIYGTGKYDFDLSD